MKYLTYRILVLSLLLVHSLCLAETPENELKNKLNAFRTFQAQFTQIIKTRSGRFVQQSQGQLLIQRPRQFRWFQTNPHQLLIVGDGKQIWNYDAKLKQVTVRRMSRQHNMPALVLSGYDPTVTQYYAVSRQEGALQLDAKRKNLQFSKLRLWFEGPRLVRMALQDNVGHNINITFSNVKLNQPIRQALFHFTPPAGVDLVR